MSKSATPGCFVWVIAFFLIALVWQGASNAIDKITNWISPDPEAMVAQRVNNALTISDVAWYSDTERYKSAILVEVNRIVSEDPTCAGFADTIGLSGSRSTALKKVFYVTCYGVDRPYVNIYFDIRE
jgi:hypothetical protein